MEVSTRPCFSQKTRSCHTDAWGSGERAQPRPRAGGQVAARKRPYLGRARHAAVLVADLAEDAALREPGEAAEVDRCLGMPVALEHAALARSQREDVAWAVEVGRHARRARQRAEGRRTVGGRDASGRARLCAAKGM